MKYQIKLTKLETFTSGSEMVMAQRIVTSPPIVNCTARRYFGGTNNLCTELHSRWT